MSAPAASCSTCRFFVGNPAEVIAMVPPTDGECRRHAPVLVPGAHLTYGAFPVVYADSWCGDHEVRK